MDIVKTNALKAIIVITINIIIIIINNNIINITVIYY